MTSASLNEGQPCFTDLCTKSAQLLPDGEEANEFSYSTDIHSRPSA